MWTGELTDDGTVECAECGDRFVLKSLQVHHYFRHGNVYCSTECRRTAANNRRKR